MYALLPTNKERCLFDQGLRTRGIERRGEQEQQAEPHDRHNRSGLSPKTGSYEIDQNAHRKFVGICYHKVMMPEFHAMELIKNTRKITATRWSL